MVHLDLSENWEPPNPVLIVMVLMKRALGFQTDEILNQIVAYVPQNSRYINISQLYPHDCWLKHAYIIKCSVCNGALVKSLLLMVLFAFIRPWSTMSQQNSLMSSRARRVVWGPSVVWTSSIRRPGSCLACIVSWGGHVELPKGLRRLSIDDTVWVSMRRFPKSWP